MLKAQLLHYEYRPTLALLTLVGLLMTWSSFPAAGATTRIDFENIPDYPTPVDAFGSMFPGVAFSSRNQWLASYVNATDFVGISNRCIGSYGAAPLTVSFEPPSRDISLDLGSGYRSQSQTASIEGFLDGQLVFSQSFETQPTPSGAEEVRAFTEGVVDQVVVFSSSGGFGLMVDNLSFTTVPEPGPIPLMFAGGLFESAAKSQPEASKFT